MPAAKQRTPEVNRNHMRGLWAITRHDAKSKVEAPVAKFYPAEDVKKPLANRRKPKLTKLNKRRICMGAVRKLKKIQIYQSHMKMIERKSLLGNEWRKPGGCECCRQRSAIASKEMNLRNRKRKDTKTYKFASSLCCRHWC